MNNENESQEKVYTGKFITHVFSEWGGSLRFFSSDGTIKNVAEELNKLEREKDQ